MIPKKPAPDLIRGGNRFSEQIMLKQKASSLLKNREVAGSFLFFIRPTWRCVGFFVDSTSLRGSGTSF
jgi:hypothetical protein